MRATFHILNWAHFDQHLHLRLQVLNCWWSQRPRHWNEGSRKELGTVGVILIKWINPQKKRTHFLKNTTKKHSPKIQLGMIRVPVISFTIFYQWFCLPCFGSFLFLQPLGLGRSMPWTVIAIHRCPGRHVVATWMLSGKTQQQSMAKYSERFHFFHNKKRVSIGRCSWPVFLF